MTMFRFRLLVAFAAAASSATDTAVHARADGVAVVQHDASNGGGTNGHGRISSASPLFFGDGTMQRNSWFPIVLYTTSPTAVATDGPTAGQTSSPSVSVEVTTSAPSGKPTAGATTSPPSGQPSSRPTTATPSKMVRHLWCPWAALMCPPHPLYFHANRASFSNICVSQ